MRLSEVSNRTDIEKLLKQYVIVNYQIHPDGTVDVGGNVHFGENSNISEIPIKFGKVTGYFSLNSCKNLTSLKNSPHYVGSNFVCADCKNLESLEGGPTVVDGNYFVEQCPKLTSLKGCPPVTGGSLKLGVGGSFYCGFNPGLKTLEGGPKEVRGEFICSSNDSLTTLEGGPTIVKWGYDCSKCQNLVSLKGAPEKTGLYFNCNECISLTSLEHAPSEIVSSFNCSKCHKLESLIHLPKSIKGTLHINDLNVRNYLTIFKTKGIKMIECSNKEIETIINKYLKTRDVIGCQDELIEAGYEEYARTK
jgi:DNA-directed RNA polymerase subunit RPC12/RpoP